MKLKAVLAIVFLCAAALGAFAGVEQTVSDLLPRLAATKVEDRYSAQIDLQNLALNAARPGAEAERAELEKVLAAKAIDPAVPQPARVWIVRQLEYIGAAESVAALTTLLNGQDAELKECARRALEKNPTPGATESLRAALKQGGETAWKIGLIQSLGERGDAQSVSLIAQCLRQPETASAATSALGKIAREEALKDLRAALGRNTAGAADALVAAANQLVARGESKSAAAIYLRLYTVPGNAPARAAALIGLAKAEPEGAKKLIAEGLSDPDWRAQTAAITAAREVYGKDASRVFADLLPGLNPGPRAFVLRVLDASAEQQLITAAGDPEEMVRLAALERLGQVGSTASILVLFKAATEGPAAAQKVAAAALARIPDPGASAAIARLAGEGAARSRAVAINALAGRNDQLAAPALLKYAAESDPEVSAAACAALAKLGTDNELEGLIQLVLSGKTPCAEAALQAVASRATDKSTAARRVIARTQTAEPGQLAPLFDVLALLGGKEALVAVSTSAASSNLEVKDAAVRALANWPDFLAAKSLLIIALDPHVKRVHNVLAIQGVARLVKSSDKEAAPARVDAALAAMKAAPRDEEKKLLLSALASVPDRKAAEAIKPYLSDPKFQKEAGLAAMNLAEALRKPDRPLAKELAQAVKQAGLSDDLTGRAEAILKKN
jgi:HEAT repeat protein